MKNAIIVLVLQFAKPACRFLMTLMTSAQGFSARGQLDKGLYEKDFYAWTQEQSALILQGRWADLDVSNLIEKIESLGR